MSEYRDTLERELERLRPPRIPLDELVGRRDRKRREQRIRAAVLGIAIAVAVGWWGFHTILSTRPTPADPTPKPSALRQDGENVAIERLGAGPGWSLAAQDPRTGNFREIGSLGGIVDCPNDSYFRCTNFANRAEWSSDGRWIAFNVGFFGPCGPTAGVWVQGMAGDPRQMTSPCDAPGSETAIDELWEWSPLGARLAYSRGDSEIEEVSVIDPEGGDLTSLGTADGNVTALAWSPDATRIAYADGGSVYVVPVDGGERSLLADSFSHIIDIDWSPDGTQIMVHDQGRYRMQVMNADGSDIHLLLEGEDACCETEWSPNGDRIVYQLSKPEDKLGFTFDSEVWTISPDGSNPIKVFDSDGCSMGDIADALPIWAPDGTRVAYNDCGSWVVANADGTGEPQPIDELLHRSWDGGGLATGWNVH